MKKTTRRAFLRSSTNLTLSLPLLQCLEHLGYAQGAEGPLKFITYSFPNGCAPELWNLQEALSPLEPFKESFLGFSQAKNLGAEKAGGDGHQEGGGSLFVGRRLRSDHSAGGISLDQYISKFFDQATPLKSPLVMGVWRGFAGGLFRPISWSRRSWLASGAPAACLSNPLEAFYFAFGLSRNQSATYLVNKKSILDATLSQYRGLIGSNSKLGHESKKQVKYIASRVREIERRLVALHQDQVIQCRSTKSAPPDFPGVDGLLPYEQFEEVFRHQMDLMVMAFQCGLTRTGSLMFGASGEEYQNTSISQMSCHGSSHYEDDHGFDIYKHYRKYHIENLAYLVTRLMETKDAAGHPLLHSTVILAGSEFGDGRNHTVSPQPLALLSGHKAFKTGQGMLDVKGQSTNDIYKTVLQGMDLTSDGFGDPDDESGLIQKALKANA